jgi:DUF4097 and DUF4098 domain-containing protein YvlB
MEGQIAAKTNSGDIQFNRINGAMILNSHSGNIKIDQYAPLYMSNELTTENGNVDFRFHAIPANLYLALTSESGTMKNSLPVKKIVDKDADYFKKRYIKGRLGNGQGNLLINTREGNIHVSLAK